MYTTKDKPVARQQPVEARRRSAGGARGRWDGWSVVLMLLAALSTVGCSLDALVKSDEIPPNVNDPALVESPAGALAAYNGAVLRFNRAFGRIKGVVDIGGLMTDELQIRGTSSDSVDSRKLSVGNDLGPYNRLQAVRGQAAQAIGLLRRYRPDDAALVGHLYVLQGYAETFLADLYCSGIPLSTVDFDGDYTYRAGSTTEQVYAHAKALFDTAFGLVGDSTQLLRLAQVGEARVRLALGEYAEAASAVASVPDGYHYEMRYSDVIVPSDRGESFAYTEPSFGQGRWAYAMPDVEGVNGMDWRSSDDPRTRFRVMNNNGNPYFHPVKYDTTGASPIALASGVEARLIEAEAALQAGSGTWLTTLNALRTDGTFAGVDTQVVSVDTMVDTMVDPPDTTYDTTFTYDTLWNAGSGGTAGLAPLDDPGTEADRLALLFRERAFWLYLTGQRQADLRRLVRLYGVFEGDVYPVGPYKSLGFPYGSDVTLPVPDQEFVNPLYQGCASRGA